MRLIPYDEAVHLKDLWAASNGSAVYAHGPYDPDEAIFRFMDDGPFASAGAMGRAPFMADLPDGLRLVVVDEPTGYVVGMASLKANAPKDLRVEIGDVWLTPAFQRTHVHRDVLWALLTHLFGAHYRRVEMHCDAADGRSRTAVAKAGFLHEGTLRKHRIIREGCNVDTAVFSLTNADWRDGARAALEARVRPPQGVSAPTRPQLAL